MSLQKLLGKAKVYDFSESNEISKETGRLDFITKFPLERLSSLSIDEYVAGTDNNSFSYWLEFKKILFGIGGGNASKFGIYKGKDGNYYGGTGQNKILLTEKELESQFQKIKTAIITALDYVQLNKIHEIKNIEVPMWNIVLLKILSIYYPDRFLAIGASQALIDLANDIKLKHIDLSPKNLVELNYECRKYFSDLTEFKNWHYEKLSSLIWAHYRKDLDDVITVQNEKVKYWLYAPGANADMWEEFYSLGIMGLGWDELGNLEQYPDKVSLVKELQEIYNTSSTYKNDANANYEFKDLISIGDIIIVKKGRSELLGYGIITSDYFYDESRSIFKSCRKIEWKKKGVWKTDHSLALKTLTEITKYSGYAEKLLYLIDGKNTGTLIDFYEQINKFIKQAQTNDLKTSSNNYLQSYLGLDVKISFGQGTASKIPWISFLRNGQTTSNGIYPVYLYFKSENLLILAYGVSVTNSPENIWNLSGPLSISDYYSENHLGGPSNYGNSYIYKVYNVNKLPDASIMNKELNDLLTYYNDLDFSDNQSITSINMQFDYNVFNNISKDAGLIFSALLIKRFIASLCTKPFLICSGLSGSGKTKLAQAFAQWISADESQYAIVPVGADWTNREPLLGYTNALNKEEYVSPENGVLDLMIRAKQNIENKEEATKPYFLILDEMNLSHVERYFADFLSTMESGDKIPLHKIKDELLDIPPSINLPKNLFIIGTVNIDETTYMFSPKVLDRANTIEFRLTESDLEDFITSDIKLDMELLKAQGANMSESFMSIALQESDKNLKPVADDLKLFFSELKKSGAEFGFRTAGEIGRLMYMLKELDETGDNLLDIAIMQKLLPKLHGSRNKLTKVLPILGGFCLSDSSKIKEDYLDKFVSNSLTEVELKADTNIKYKISFEKICRMYKNAVENGFASYAEA